MHQNRPPPPLRHSNPCQMRGNIGGNPLAIEHPLIVEGQAMNSAMLNNHPKLRFAPKEQASVGVTRDFGRGSERGMFHASTLPDLG